MPELITSKNIQGISDLVVCAPIKTGFITAFENVTYETRLRLATKAFFQLRNYAREYELIKPFTDTAERIQSLLDFRIGILDTQPQRSMILAATFDRGWEPYMRTIYDPLGSFLDVLLCNCEGYVSAGDHSFAEFAGWVREHQVDSTIFYATTPLTVGDQQYLSKLERVQRKGVQAGSGKTAAEALDLQIAKMTFDDPETLARGVRTEAFGDGDVAPDQENRQKLLTMSIEGLEVLYRLADYYPPDSMDSDGKYLLRAAQNLFKGWDTTDGNQLPGVVKQFKRELFAWFDKPPPSGFIPGRDPRKLDRREIQAGVLSGYNTPPGQLIQHGAMLLLRVENPENARKYLKAHTDETAWTEASQAASAMLSGADTSLQSSEVSGMGISYQEEQAPSGPLTANTPDAAVSVGDTQPPRLFVNLAITYQGLKSLQIEQSDIDGFPREFSEGMAARAMAMGDIAGNHPQHWTPPQRFGYPAGEPPVELSEVDLISQLRTTGGKWNYIDLPSDIETLKGSEHPLAKVILANLAVAKANGVALLSIQPMRRIAAEDGQGKQKETGEDVQTRDHFGFKDGLSQPALDRRSGAPARDVVSKGELVLGYRNDRGDPATCPEFQRDGSFLVIRKMSQNLAALEAIEPPEGMDTDTLLAKMVGRSRDGVTLVTAPKNDFNYSGDPEGVSCPFQAHIRRANPRVAKNDDPPFGRPLPRIMRRGMSYGPTGDETKANPTLGDERGVIFMAYNASIAEQFEVVQRWVNGGNITGVAAAQNDALFGTFPAQGGKTFRFVDGERVHRVDIPETTVALEWGLYAFVPSRTTLLKIIGSAAQKPSVGARMPDKTADDRQKAIPPGKAILDSLEAMAPDNAKAAWKIYLEDFSTKDPDERCDSPDLWSYIREARGGAVRSPNGVIVASRTLVDRVLDDTDGTYSVGGQNLRMRQSFGEIYVGLDAGDQYVRDSTETNDLLMRIGKCDAFAVAFEAAKNVLFSGILAVETVNVASGVTSYPVEFDARADFLTPALGAICQYWFGLPDSELKPDRAIDPPGAAPFIEAGGWNWDPLASRKPRCPGDYMAPSRYCFYPAPTDAISAYGMAQGQALRVAAKQWVDTHRPTRDGAPPAKPKGLLAKGLFALESLKDNDLLARTIIGLMVGALPPVDGNLRAVLYDWLQDKSFWRWQSAFLALAEPQLNPNSTDKPDQIMSGLFAAAKEAIEPAMKSAMLKRPAPDLLFRIALKNHKLGNVEVETDDKIVLVVAAATQEGFDDEDADVYPIFGGKRKGEPPDGHIAFTDGATHETTPHPLHACPAYDMAMGTMLGILAAFMSFGRIEALPAPLLVRLTATGAAKDAADKWRNEQILAAAAPAATPTVQAATPAVGPNPSPLSPARVEPAPAV